MFLHLLVNQMETHLDVQISEVLPVLSHGNRSVQLLSLLDSEWSVQIKHRLLPVGVLFVRRCAQRDWVLQIRENGVKPDHKGVDIVAVVHLELVVVRKFDFRLLALNQIEIQDAAGVRHNVVTWDSIDHRVFEYAS